MFGKKRLEKNQGWADLHEDVLLLIKGKLGVVDQLRFRGVCRNWRALSYVRSADKLPWVVVLRWVWEFLKDRYIGCNLYDPSNNQEYIYGRELKRCGESIIVYGSKYGWVFLAVLPSNKLYIYHPFTMKTIDLPAMNKVELSNSKGTFSTTPTCSDCVFCMITNEGSQDDHKIRLYTCRTGDAMWIESNLEIPGGEGLFVNDVIYRKGLFYCVFQEGLLWTFDISCYDCQQVPVDASEITNIESKIETEGYWYKVKMIESNGEFLLVYYCTDQKPWYIFKLDWSLRAWVQEVTLCYRALFLGATSLSVPTDGEIESLAGHIYFRGSYRYSYHDFENNAGQQSSKLKRLKCKYYSSFKRFSRSDEWVWVEPYL